MRNVIRLLTIVLFSLVCSAATFAAPAVTVWPNVGPPTSKVTVNGTGFGANAAIDVYYDTAHLCLAFASSTGAASCTITVPKDAQPQWHWVSMLQRNNGTGAQKPHLVRTDMAQFHGRDARHSGYNPFENTLNAGNVVHLDTLWSRPIGPLGTYGSAVVAGGRVYVGGRDGKLYAFNAATGADVAGFPKVTTGQILYSTPAVGYGRVFVGSDDLKLHAYSAATGGPVSGFPIHLGCFVRSSPSLALGNVYVGCSNGKLYAFNATTGAPVPSFPVDVYGDLRASPTVIGGKVYMGSPSNNAVYAFDALTGAPVGGFSPIVTGAPIFSTVAATGATGFFGSMDSYLRGFRLATGVITPGFPALTSLGISSSPAIAGGQVYVGAEDGVFFAFFTSGGFAWSRPLGGSAYSSPMVANNVVYTSTTLRLYALSAANGAILWSADATASGFRFSSPVVADGILYYPSDDGYLYAFSVHGEPVSARLPGGALGVKPALSALRPDLSLRAR